MHVSPSDPTPKLGRCSLTPRTGVPGTVRPIIMHRGGYGDQPLALVPARRGVVGWGHMWVYYHSLSPSNSTGCCWRMRKRREWYLITAIRISSLSRFSRYWVDWFDPSMGKISSQRHHRCRSECGEWLVDRWLVLRLRRLAGFHNNTYVFMWL